MVNAKTQQQQKELHQLHLDEEALREISEKEAKDEKERKKKIRQKQADDEEFMLEFGMKYDSEYEIIPGPAGIVQAAKLLKQRDMLLGMDGDVMSTQEYIKKAVEDVSENEDFKSGSWVSATDYVNANGGTVSGCLGDIKNFLNNGKLDQVVAIVKSCSPNVIGDLTVTMKDLSVFSPKSSMHYLNITKRNVVKVFRKDTIPRSGSG
ncbi:hypothetical protein Tco_0285232 [Tanacetum coccineum]